MSKPFLTVAIPLFHTEPYLQRCLESVALQLETFSDFEVMVINDEGHDFKSPFKNYKKIIKAFKKTYKIPLTYIEHNHNLGLLETRRDSVLAANGKYICILDSDDTLAPNALFALSQAAKKSNADIIHGHYSSGYWENNQFIQSEIKKDTQTISPSLQESEIINKWLIEKQITNSLWSKLIKTEVYKQALDQIPYTLCNLAEDFIQFFFIAQFAKTYEGIPQIVYNYTVTTGMSATKKIDNLRDWIKICSTASVFTVIFMWLVEKGFLNENGTIVEKESFPKDSIITEEIINCVKQYSVKYLKNNLLQLENAVIPELRQKAYEYLCEYWGKDYVEKTA